jgi:arylsulfatase A-like enzyme
VLLTLIVATVAAVGFSFLDGESAGGGGGGPATSATTPERPNIVLILTDDMRTDELQYMPSTRRLLADHGTSYTGAISPHPMCCPARAELVTGQYAQNNGVKHNLGPFGGVHALRHPNDNIGVWMQRAGYRTGYHGKFLNGYSRAFGRVAGWDVWDPIVAGTTYLYWRSVWFDGDSYHHRYITHVTAERTTSMLDTLDRGRAPFFMVVNHTAPHARTGDVVKKPAYEPRYGHLFDDLQPDFTRKPSYFAKDPALPHDLYDRTFDRKDELVRARARARALRSVDDDVRLLVHQLAAAGELDNTYIVFTSDNGFVLGEHGLHGKNLMIDESLDVPLIVRGPGIPAGAVNRTPVTLVDLAATFLHWGHAVPSAARPSDGLPITEPSALARRDTILVQAGDSSRADHGWWYRGVDTRRYLYAVHPRDPSVGVLFDRDRDPFALHDVLHDPAYAPVRREMAHRLAVLENCSGAGCNRVFGPVPDPLPERKRSGGARGPTRLAGRAR